MKRSRSIKLVLIGGLSAGALAGCESSSNLPRAFRSGNVYTNNYHIARLGYYHAPFRAWYPLPYNHYDAQRNAYYHGGTWSPAPQMTITNLSEPTPDALRAARAATAPAGTVSRSGFGSTSRHYGVYS